MSQTEIVMNMKVFFQSISLALKCAKFTMKVMNFSLISKNVKICLQNIDSNEFQQVKQWEEMVSIDIFHKNLKNPSF